MSKKILITGGAVHAFLDSNKIVSNRTRGLWARKFAEYCVNSGHEVTLLLPEIGNKEDEFSSKFRINVHKGFYDYQKICLHHAETHDVAIMAAAVTNWIPEKPFEGKMPTDVDRILVPFILAPRVIDDMRKVNSKLTLIGCKLTICPTLEETFKLAQKTMEGSKAHAVIANDLKRGLKEKYLCFPDGSIHEFIDDFPGLFRDLLAMIEDEHFRTDAQSFVTNDSRMLDVKQLMVELLQKYGHRFVTKYAGHEKAFGSIAVRTPFGGALMTPREKSKSFQIDACVNVLGMDETGRSILTEDGKKATMNAPLLMRMIRKFNADYVIHLHEILPDVPTQAYASPGTVRDSLRDLQPAFNIEGHGFIAAYKDGKLVS